MPKKREKDIGGEKDLALSEKKERFCEEYIQDYNACEAAKRAGYSEKYARAKSYLLLQEPEVSEKIKNLQRVYGSSSVYDSKSRVLKEVWNMYELAMEKKPVIVWNKDTKEYVETGETQFDEKTAIKCLEFIAKLCGALPEGTKKQEKNESEGVEIFVRVEGEDEI